jgi:hypothetical protein
LFEVSRSKHCPLIQLRQTGKNHSSSPYDYLVISRFEVFGTLMGVGLARN